MNYILSSGLFITYLTRITLGQIADDDYDCCGRNLMDTRGRVAIETRRQLTSGMFVALRVRSCTTDPIAVQIWRQTGNGVFSFRWQTVISPVLSNATQTFTTVNFATGLLLTSDDRLGIFSPFNPRANMSILSIPFGFDGNNYYLYYSTAAFGNFTTFSDAVQVTADDLRWPRSFVGSVFFCQISDCFDITSQTPPTMQTTYSPFPSPTPLADQCCPNRIACDPSGMNGTLVNQSQAISDITNEINEITAIIRNLLSAQGVVTGICPQGFMAGTYGVGKCYLVIRNLASMAVAALRCQTEYNTQLVQIRNDVEEAYLRSILSSPGDTSFWTAGMYNRDSHLWVWYDESRNLKSPVTYTNWKNGVRPTPSTDDDVCMTLELTQGVTNSSYWAKTGCNDQKFFVCQIYKTCL